MNPRDTFEGRQLERAARDVVTDGHHDVVVSDGRVGELEAEHARHLAEGGRVDRARLHGGQDAPVGPRDHVALRHVRHARLLVLLRPEHLELAEEVHNRPTVIIAHNIKGKGDTFMENRSFWHGNVPDAEQIKQALAELGEASHG
mgnify:CR=1 FL=1